MTGRAILPQEAQQVRTKTWMGRWTASREDEGEEGGKFGSEECGVEARRFATKFLVQTARTSGKLGVNQPLACCGKHPPKSASVTC